MCFLNAKPADDDAPKLHSALGPSQYGAARGGD
jgi:hypothetical protein